MGNARMRAEQINYGASNVKVALDDLDPKDLIALSARMDTIEAWKATVKAEEKTGSSVEFTNALSLPAVSVSAEIVASQDLHGFDKPWVGGAGKNLLPMTVAGIKALNTDGTWSGNDYVFRGVTFTILTDNNNNVIGIKANNTATDRAFFYIAEADYGSENFSFNTTINGYTYSGTLIAEYQYVFYNKSGHKTYIMIDTGQVLDNVVFYPQRELGNTPTAFEPYTNICPISGFSSVVITDTDSESHTATVTVSLGSTVYGGTLNLTTGELTVDKAMVTLDDTDNWSVDSVRTHSFSVTKDLGLQTIWTAEQAQNAISNIAYASGDDAYYGRNSAFAYSGASHILYLSNSNISNVADLKAILSNTPLQICGLLATPTTTTLTAAQLEMVKGYNHISANSGDITVKAYTGAPWGGDTI